MRDRPNAIDTAGEVAVFGAAFMVIGLLIGGGIVVQNPNIVDEAFYAVYPAEYGGGEIVFTREQVRDMSDIYRAKEEEFSWCMRIDGNKVEQLDVNPETFHSDASSISWRCKSFHNGIIHTHPGPYGIAELSELDRETIREADQFRVSCVLAGDISDAGDNPVAFNCFDTDLNRLNVRIVGEA